MSFRAPVIRGCTLLMEAMWTYAVVAFLVAALAVGGKPSFLGVCAVVFLSYGISRGLQNSDVSLGVLRAWGTLLSLLVFYAIVRIDFFGNLRLWDFSWANGIFNDTTNTIDSNTAATFGVPILAAFWARGVMRGQESAGFEAVISSFGIGVLIIAVVEVFQGSVDDSPGMVGQIAVPYVAFGLFAIGLAHSERAEGHQGRPFSRTLLTALAVSIAAIAVAAAIIALFDVVTGYEGVRSAAESAANAGKDIANVILWPIGKLLDGIFAAIVWLRDHILGSPQQPDANQQNADQGPTCIQALTEQGKTLAEAQAKCNATAKPLPDWVQFLVRLIVAVPLVGLGILAVSLLFSRFRKRRTAGEIKESSYQQGRFGSDLGNLFQNLVGRLRPNIHIGREHLDQVRRLYFEVVEDGEHRGVRREPSQTPDELAPSLDRTFAGPAPGHITSAFDEARYGRRAPPDADVRRLREEWETLRRG